MAPSPVYIHISDLIVPNETLDSNESHPSASAPEAMEDEELGDLQPLENNESEGMATTSAGEITVSPAVARRTSKYNPTGDFYGKNLWVRRFRDGLKDNDPNVMYYVGTMKIYKSEANLPNKLREALEKWLSLDIPPEQRNATQRKEFRRRQILVKEWRAAAAELGINHQDHPSLAPGRICMDLEFVVTSISQSRNS
ncbi:unnamed protein product [Fusarium graminearum]|nr:hypothetical protein HG531_000353 [Fusarium graminearum]CZS82577.1 unnamed protein product [Fusarium graminearum]